MARTKNTFIKDIVYEEYYVILFRYRDLIYVYCRPNCSGRSTFVPLNIMSSALIPDLNIFKYTAKDSAMWAIRKIPPFEIGNDYADLEVCKNTYLPELL